MTYERWKVRVSSIVILNCRRVAMEQGWEVSDFLRALIFLSANAKFLNLPNNDVFKRLATLTRMLGGHREYPSPGSRTELVSIRLPAGFAGSLKLYGRWTGRSQSSLAGSLITAGLMIYLKAETALLKAIQEVAEKPSPSFPFLIQNPTRPTKT
jgi:hypothetical protein